MRVALLFLLLSVGLYTTASANCDSVGVKVINAKTFIMHKVEKSQGLYAISRRYKVPVDVIQKSNPETKNGLEVGQIVLVPYNKKVAVKSEASAPRKAVKPVAEKKKEEEEPVETASAEGRSPIYHTVTAGETLYHIAVNHKLTVAQMQKMNHIGPKGIASGQKLVVGYNNSSAASETKTASKIDKKTSKTIASNASRNNDDDRPLPEGSHHKNKLNVYGDKVDDKIESQYDSYQKDLDAKRKSGKVETKEVKESGMASWIDDGSVVSEKNLAMAKTAPPGTVIQLTNPMNKKVVYVKVIAQLPPDNGSDNDVAIKITKTAADKLGVLDKYFRVDMHYTAEVVKQ
jgi:LysM repeat protein